jgi:hypothetical protein
MGNRTSLVVSTPRQELFETTNSLACFWLGFLGPEVMDRMNPLWAADDAPPDLVFAVPRAEASANAGRFAAHIDAIYPALSDLYAQFADFVLSTVSEDGDVELDLTEYAAFTSAREFVADLRGYVEGVAAENPDALGGLSVDDDDLRANATGWDVADFAEFSPLYQAIDENDGLLPGTALGPESSPDDDPGSAVEAGTKLTWKEWGAIAAVVVGVGLGAIKLLT